MSRVSQSVGRAFEEYIALTAEMMGWVLMKQHPPVLRQGRKVVVVGRAYPDFVLFRPDGQAIVFDAKSVGGNRFRAPAQRRHQYDFMQLLALRAPWVDAGYLLEWRETDERERSFQWVQVLGYTTWPVVAVYDPSLVNISLEEVLRGIGRFSSYRRP